MNRLLALAAAALLCACEPPPVFATSDPRQSSLNSHIEGEVLVTGHTRGNVLLFLYDALRPPPPQGSGHPVSFTVISGEAMFGAAAGDRTSGGPFVAPFAFSQVAPGRYLIRAVLDNAGGGDFPDRVPDFIPWFGVTSDANMNDVGGAAVDAVTRAPLVLTLARQPDGTIPPLTGISVSIQESAGTVVPADRPVFAAGGSATFAPKMGDPATDGQLTLTVSPTRSGPIDQRAPFFLARYIDDDHDGVPDKVNGVEQFWPKVIVRKLAEADPAMLTDENDLDHNGVLDETGVDYAHLDGSNNPVAPDGKPDAVILAAGLNPQDVVPALRDPGTGQPKTAIDPLTGQLGFATVPLAGPLHLILGTSAGPVALDISNPAAPQRLAAIPPGKYAIIVMQLTGQTWRVPNELNPAVAAPAQGPATGLPAIASQAFVLTVTPQ